MISKQYRLPVAVFILTFILLAFVQVKVERPMILAERFIKGGGWAEILLISLYGSFVVFKMQDPVNVPKWRKITWTLCGDCLAGCHHNSIKYKYFKLRPELARNLFLILTISLHASCIALARI